MDVVYNSDNYYIVQYVENSGYEIVDKHAALGAYLDGRQGEEFLLRFQAQVERDKHADAVDDFLACFRCIMLNPVCYH